MSPGDSTLPTPKPAVCNTQRNVVLYSTHQRNCGNKYPAAAEMGDRFATIDMGRGLRTQAGWRKPRLMQQAHDGKLYVVNYLPPYQVASKSIQPFGHNRHGPKSGGSYAPFGRGGAGSPSNTMWLGPRPTSIPSGILIHPTVWPRYTNVTDWTGQTDRTDNGPIAYGEPFYKRSPKNDKTDIKKKNTES